MAKNHQSELRYDPSAYNESALLKLNIPAWLIIGFIMRPFLIFIASVTIKTDRYGLLNLFYPDPKLALITALMATPTFALLISLVKRKSNAQIWVRAIWNQGRYLLAASLTLNIITLSQPWIFDSRSNPAVVFQIGLCCVMIYYIFRSARLRDTFLDFPTRVSKST